MVKQDNKFLKKDLESILKKSSDLGVILKIDKAYSDNHTINVSMTDVVDSKFLRYCPLDNKAVDNIIASIKNKGIIQPTVGRFVGGKYEIVVGRKRYYAYKKMNRPTLPMIIVELEDEEACLMELFYILEQSQHNVVELASLYQFLAVDKSYTKTSLAEITKQSIGQVSNLIRILKLPKEVLVQLSNNEISYGHAKIIVNLPKEKISSIIPKIIKNDLSVRDVESLVRNYNSDNVVSEAEELIKEKLAAKSVRITRNSIRINFKSKRKMAAYMKSLLK
ncbi:MAG: ParB/RepB/Spo0J family partition protein [Bacilli bacterium]